MSDDHRSENEFNGEEACFHYMIMDLEYFIRKEGVKLIDDFLSQEVRNKIIEYYASKR
jgi:hypothetical protein